VGIALCILLGVIVQGTQLLESPEKSWIFVIENFRTWKVLENHFGPGKSWKNVLESHAVLHQELDSKLLELKNF